MESVPVWSKHSCCPLVILEKAAEPMLALHAAIFCCRSSNVRCGEQKQVIFALMVSFAVAMGAVFIQNAPQPTRPEHDELRQTLLLNRPNSTFGEGIQIRTSGTEGNCPDS